MKRSTFTKPTYKEAIKKQREKQKKEIQRKPHKAVKKRTRSKKQPVKTISAPIPNWIKAIPESQSHGSGTYQKRLWKLVSDYVRIRDFYKYGYCAATGTHFERWKDSQAGHLKPYTNCNCLYKFDVRNIHAQHGNSNKFGNYDTFRDMEKEVKRRGYDWDAFEKENNAENGCRLYDSDVVEKMKDVLELMAELPESPYYFVRSYTLLHSE